jgi:pilus assembly protein CpaE
VIVDAGSHVTPAQAAVVELADEVVALTSPDVLSIRALRRSITQWENLGVRKETDVRVLVNRVSRQTAVSAETVRQLTRAAVIGTALPAMFRRLEPALNARDPFAVRDEIWWRSLRAVGQEVGLVAGPAGSAPGAAAPAIEGSRRRRRGRDVGQATIETISILPVVLLVAVLVWQLALYGATMVWSGHAANAAARALSVHQNPAAAAQAAVPGSVAGAINVNSSGDSVTVRVRVPLLTPAVASLPLSVSTTRKVVVEP